MFSAWLSNGIANLMILRANRPVIPLRIGFGGRRPPLQAFSFAKRTGAGCHVSPADKTREVR
jgi:hypothetical protein